MDDVYLLTGTTIFLYMIIMNFESENIYWHDFDTLAVSDV